MSNIVGLFGQQPPEAGEPRPALVALLEGLLERARAGEVQSLIGTGFTAGGARLAVWCDAHGNVYEMLGALAWLQHEYVHRHTESLE